MRHLAERLSAALIVKFGWPSAFLLGGSGSLALALVLYLFLPESRVSSHFSAAKKPRSLRSCVGYVLISAVITLRVLLLPTTVCKFRYIYHITEGRALMTSLLWIAFVTSLMGHYFLTSWLPTVLTANGVPLGHAVVAGSLIQGAAHSAP